MGGDGNSDGAVGGDGGGGGFSLQTEGSVGETVCSVDHGSDAGGGGGGVGRIRLNVGNGSKNPPVAIFSPSENTAAFSMGALSKKPLDP